MTELMTQLAAARDRGELSEISYQFCLFLHRIDPECSDEMLLAGCLASQRVENGDVCVKLADEAETSLFGNNSFDGVATPKLEDWVSRLKQSKSVGMPGEARPLILDRNHRLYLHKYWTYEALLADQLRTRAVEDEKSVNMEKLQVELEKLFSFDSAETETDWQKVAAWTAFRKKFVVISGGPGTGKTTTVVKILLLMARLGHLKHVAMAAPTGKAASRLMESVNNTLNRFQPGEQALSMLPDQAYTIHKLLGARRHGSEFKYNRDNPLPYNLVVIDEASMIDLALMVKLVEALPAHARLILLGDKDQLASVEAGAVMGSICADTDNRFSTSFLEDARQVGLKIPDRCRHPDPKPLTDHIVLLEKSYRFGKASGIGRLASSILSGNTGKVSAILDDPELQDVTLKEFRDLRSFKEILSETLTPGFLSLFTETEIEKALNAIDNLGVLCVHRRGPQGAEQINRVVEQVLREQNVIPAASEWYAGKRVMVTRNDYSLGLRNGELGITLKDENGDLKVYFPESGGTYRSFYPSRLSAIETAYATTVHKSQGSEFNTIAVILPPRVSQVSSREMLYTAVTRSRERCTIIGDKQVLEGTVKRKIDRSSGLKDRLWKTGQQGALS
ncbi:exodeoxyribonuclease V subunit alpha [Halalkalibaculum sp. DA3122]